MPTELTLAMIKPDAVEKNLSGAILAHIEKAGFKLVTSGDFLRNPQDPRDKPVFRPEQPVDEFILKFERPR